MATDKNRVIDQVWNQDTVLRVPDVPGGRCVLRYRFQTDFRIKRLRLECPDDNVRVFDMWLGDRIILSADEGLKLNVAFPDDEIGADFLRNLFTGLDALGGTDLRVDLYPAPTALKLTVDAMSDVEVLRHDHLMDFDETLCELAAQCKGLDADLRQQLHQSIDEVFDSERHEHGGDAALLLRTGKLPADPAEGAVPVPFSVIEGIDDDEDIGGFRRCPRCGESTGLHIARIDVRVSPGDNSRVCDYVFKGFERDAGPAPVVPGPERPTVADASGWSPRGGGFSLTYECEHCSRLLTRHEDFHKGRVIVRFDPDVVVSHPEIEPTVSDEPS
ncbi:MAG: hypothetical protein EPN91_10730 [Salinibacterium sp.]|nr:MAG: hypothetical protein EPN91_10730 [Salinibacterium sp.]